METDIIVDLAMLRGELEEFLRKEDVQIGSSYKIARERDTTQLFSQVANGRRKIKNYFGGVMTVVDQRGF